MDYPGLEDKTSKIIDNLQFLKHNIALLKKKIITIQDVNLELEKNKILKQDPDSNLSFQSNMLKNEFSYYTSIYNFITTKYSKELFELSEYILIILVSLNKLEIGNEEKKKNIFSKIIYTKKDNQNSGNLKNVFLNIINNLKLVDDFIQIFNEYISKLELKNNKKNLHCNNFEIKAKYKKEMIIIEYNKYCDKFVNTTNYFMKCCKKVINQIESSELLKFFLNIKLKDNE